MNFRNRSNRHGANLLFVFCTMFFAMFFLGAFMIKSIKAPPSTPLPQSSDSNGIKFFLVMVDDLNYPTPKLDSLWMVSIDTNLNKIFFLEMSNDANWDHLQNSFSIQQNLTLSPTFLQEAETIISDSDGYILLDRWGASSIIAARLPEQAHIQSSTMINGAQMEAYCLFLNDPKQASNLGIGALIKEQHIAINADAALSVELIELFSLSNDHRSCAIKSAGVK